MSARAIVERMVPIRPGNRCRAEPWILVEDHHLEKQFPGAIIYAGEVFGLLGPNGTRR